MNERIKQITGQVLDEIVPETWVALGYDKIKEIQNRTAELIVKECLKLNSKELSITAIERLLPLYKEHFGVEE
jgi:hypothetical protein